MIWMVSTGCGCGGTTVLLVSNGAFGSRKTTAQVSVVATSVGICVHYGYAAFRASIWTDRHTTSHMHMLQGTLD